MKISVIIPVYNVEDYLSECMESVIRQTYQDFEIVLVDDGSTDNSGLICEEYAVCYPQKIKVIHKENGGLLKARITGIREALGDVLVFLDSDDTLKQDALERINSYFVETVCDMLIYNAEETPSYASIIVRHPFKNEQIFDEKSKKDIYVKLLLGELPNSVCLKAIRSSCVYLSHHYFDYRVINGEDLLLTACFLTNCKKIICINDGLYYYRNRPGSAVHQFNMEKKDSVKIVHIELGKYLDQWGIPELKPLHNARKVRGWTDQLKLLLENKKNMENNEFYKELDNMSTDSYFVEAYNNMDALLLSPSDRRLAYLLYKRRYSIIFLICFVKQVLTKTKVNP